MKISKIMKGIFSNLNEMTNLYHNKFVDIVNRYGSDNELEIFHICADEGIELAGSTIDKISLVGDRIYFFFNENEGDCDEYSDFRLKDLMDFCDALVGYFQKQENVALA